MVEACEWYRWSAVCKLLYVEGGYLLDLEDEDRNMASLRRERSMNGKCNEILQLWSLEVGGG